MPRLVKAFWVVAIVLPWGAAVVSTWTCIDPRGLVVEVGAAVAVTVLAGHRWMPARVAPSEQAALYLADAVVASRRGDPATTRPLHSVRAR
jgi:hypothetical protein